MVPLVLLHDPGKKHRLACASDDNERSPRSPQDSEGGGAWWLGWQGFQVRVYPGPRQGDTQRVGEHETTVFQEGRYSIESSRSCRDGPAETVEHGGARILARQRILDRPAMIFKSQGFTAKVKALI